MKKNIYIDRVPLVTWLETNITPLVVSLKVSIKFYNMFLKSKTI